MQKKSRCISRMLIWLLTAALCSGLLAVPAAAGEEAPSWPRDVPLDVRDDWKDPELGPAILTELEALIQDALDAAEADAPAEEVAALYDLATGKYDEFFTQFTLCYWEYFRDPEANAELYAAWNSDANYAISLITEASQSLFAGPYQDVFRKEFGDTYWELTLSQPICGEE